MYHLIRPVLFKLDPEQAHHIILRLLHLPIAPLLSILFNYSNPRLAVSAFGLTFANPVGLAAGYDKNGSALRGLAALGFGHLEVGTVTRQRQPGNPRPRLFRLPEDQALINRMGFPNDGAQKLMDRRAWSGLASRVGINIGKSKDTLLEQAAEDYCALLRQVAPRADYIAINVSSPNTPGLRQLQTKTFLADLLSQIAAARKQISNLKSQNPKPPVLIKIAPDLSNPELDDILDATLAHGFDGVIATNTTLSRVGLRSAARAEVGGLSGQPARHRSTEMIRYIYKHTGGQLPIIGVGGINSAAAALEKIRAGATLIQIYTGLVYEGPGLVKAINRGLAASGARDLKELVGIDS
jgi:dihydroorotate dehydrogenase